MSSITQNDTDKHLCSICRKNVSKSNLAIECTNCKLWTPIKCNYLDSKDYKYHQYNPEESFYCIKCMEDNIPFTKLTNNEFDVSVKHGVNALFDIEKTMFSPTPAQQIMFSPTPAQQIMFSPTPSQQIMFSPTPAQQIMFSPTSSTTNYVLTYPITTNYVLTYPQHNYVLTYPPQHNKLCSHLPQHNKLCSHLPHHNKLCSHLPQHNKLCSIN